MAGNQLPISNIVNISVSATPTGASMPNTSNCALFSDETPDPVFSDGYKIYREPTEVGEDFGTDSDTYKMALALFSQAPNILANSGYLVIFTMEPSETLDGAITRTKDLVAYCGMAATWIESEQETLDAAAVAQALNKILFVVQRNDAALDVTTGLLWKLQDGSLSHTRGLYYGGATDLSALQMKAAYMGRAMSTIFSGSNTIRAWIRRFSRNRKLRAPTLTCHSRASRRSTARARTAISTKYITSCGSCSRCKSRASTT
jgi:hypothetical protein